MSGGEVMDGSTMMSGVRRGGEMRHIRTVETTHPTSQSSHSTDNPVSSKRFLEAVEATKLNLGTHPILSGEPMNQTFPTRTRTGGGLTQAVWCRAS